MDFKPQLIKETLNRLSSMLDASIKDICGKRFYPIRVEVFIPTVSAEQTEEISKIYFPIKVYRGPVLKLQRTITLNVYSSYWEEDDFWAHMQQQMVHSLRHD